MENERKGRKKYVGIERKRKRKIKIGKKKEYISNVGERRIWW